MNKQRLTVDMSSDDHIHLKSTCAKLGVSMREFILKATFEKMQEIEDQLLAEKADKILDEIESGKRKTVKWEDVKKKL